jgi:hypothetical protein
MAARSFEDSTGVTWEVFEVHRTSDKPGAVSAGLEKGWLAFVSEGAKRRLAPIPPDWFAVSERELEVLCASARQAMRPDTDSRGLRPQIRRRKAAEAQGPAPQSEPAINGVKRTSAEGQGAASAAALFESALGAATVEELVRAFARKARSAELPAIEAMVRLKGLLVSRFPEENDAHDTRRVRRWFVESYYFERES